MKSIIISFIKNKNGRYKGKSKEGHSENIHQKKELNTGEGNKDKEKEERKLKKYIFDKN